MSKSDCFGFLRTIHDFLLLFLHFSYQLKNDAKGKKVQSKLIQKYEKISEKKLIHKNGKSSREILSVYNNSKREIAHFKKLVNFNVEQEIW